MRTSWTVPTPRLWHGVPLSPPWRAIRATLPDRQERGDSLHHHGRDEALCDLAIGARREFVGRSERRSDPERDAATGMREALALGPDPLGTADPDRHDRSSRAQRQQSETVTRLVERAVRTARPFREHEQDVTPFEDPNSQPECLHVR